MVRSVSPFCHLAHAQHNKTLTPNTHKKPPPPKKTTGYAAHFVEEYIEASIGRDALHVGELWVDLAWGDETLEYDQNGARQKLCDWIDGTKGTSSAFDFVTKGVLQEAVKRCEYWRLADKDNKAIGLIGWWPAKAVTFIANHDTDSSQSHWCGFLCVCFSEGRRPLPFRPR